MKVFRILSLLIIAALVLGACGPTPAPAPTEAPAPAEEATEAPAPEVKEKVKI